jgi:hypothetical protein
MIELKVGDTVWVNCNWYQGKAKVSYIDKPSLYQHHLYPIQVELERAYDSGHTVLRVNLEEIGFNQNEIDEKNRPSESQYTVEEDGQLRLF